jgi:anthranilate synthase component 1
MTHEQFQSLAAQGYNRIPVMREVLADLDTPLSTYLKLADAP